MLFVYINSLHVLLISHDVSCPCTAIPTAPSPPRKLTMTGAPTGSTVELNWLLPLHPNGAIHYEIEYEPAMTPGDPMTVRSTSSRPYFILTLPNEFLTYNVTVAALNTQGRARSGVLTVMCPGRSTSGGMKTEYTIESVILSSMLSLKC